jgi:hypothetical protein
MKYENMNIRIFLIVFSAIIQTALIGCKKEGCTSSCARNYDYEAKEDDGSCQGCTNAMSTNYCSGASIDDGSCIPECKSLDYGWINIANTCPQSKEHKHVIDGINEPLVAAGSNQTYKLAEGQHTVKVLHTDGSVACSESTPYVIVCKTQYVYCSH